MDYNIGKGKPPKHTRFKRGQSGNPDGARRHDPVKRLLKNLAADEFIDLINEALVSNIDGLKRIIRDPNSSIIKIGVATALLKAIQRGDWKTFNGIIERAIGKVPVKVDHTSGGKAIKQQTRVTLYLPANGRTREENEAG